MRSGEECAEQARRFIRLAAKEPDPETKKRLLGLAMANKALVRLATIRAGKKSGPAPSPTAGRPLVVQRDVITGEPIPPAEAVVPLPEEALPDQAALVPERAVEKGAPPSPGDQVHGHGQNSSTGLSKTSRSSRWTSETTVPISILAGAALIALAILFVFRWEIVSPSPAVTHRLDRWTGQIVFCIHTARKMLCE
jgi:hypothetical protein